jgi:hypothetical protein
MIAFSELPPNYLDEKLALGPEMTVDGALGHARGISDIAKRNRVVTVLFKQLGGDTKE